LPLLKLCTDGFEIETEIVVCSVKAGLRVTEVPSFEPPRRHGVSNLHAVRDGVRVLSTLLRRRVSRFPGRLRNPWAAHGYATTPASLAVATIRPATATSQAAGRAILIPASEAA